MSKYKIILVDDEEEIRQGMIKKINWEELGFVVVGEAENGIEALDIIDKTSPDIVITDIRMPFMDGIKLAENIKYRFPTTKVVIISGFDEFEYAQTAMGLGVLRYILKPINSIEMSSLLNEIKVSLDEERHSKNDIQTLKHNYKKSLPILKERFLNHWIEDYVEINTIKENIETFELSALTSQLAVAVLRPDDILKKDTDIALIKNKALLHVAIFNICEEIVKENKLGVIFMRTNEIVILMSLEETEAPKTSNRILLGLEQIRTTVEKYLNITITIGVGNECQDLSILYKSYASALSALDYTVMLGNNKIIYIEDIEPSMSQELKLDEVDERALLMAIKLGTPEDIKEIIDTLIDRIDGMQVYLKDYQLYIIDILSIILNFVTSMKLDWDLVWDKKDNFLLEINKLKTKEKINAWLFDICIKISNELVQTRNHNKNDLIEKAKDHIQHNYSDEDLNAEKLCDMLHISTNYFSALFKKETGLTFTTYLTKTRIDQAKKLLRNTDLKTFDIGNQVGYSQGHYFSYVFKKNTGISPTEYRNGKE
ncbi:MAG TPA: response regulator [Epulopiscium sp.]|nr:response regulator [Candidatus Epulonipiscium sp.]